MVQSGPSRPFCRRKHQQLVVRAAVTCSYAVCTPARWQLGTMRCFGEVPSAPCARQHSLRRLVLPQVLVRLAHRTTQVALNIDVPNGKHEPASDTRLRYRASLANRDPFLAENVLARPCCLFRVPPHFCEGVFRRALHVALDLIRFCARTSARLRSLVLPTWHPPWRFLRQPLYLATKTDQLRSCTRPPLCLTARVLRSQCLTSPTSAPSRLPCHRGY